MQTLTRDFISDNYQSVDINPLAIEYTTISSTNKEQLVRKIDHWKYVLTETCGAKKGDRILIGLLMVDSDYLAICFASFELSLVVTIADQQPAYLAADKVNPKVKILSPINIYIHDTLGYSDSKTTWFIKYCDRSFSIHDLRQVQVENRQRFDEISAIRPDPDDILMICTSSGTTNTPKLLAHTHRFFYELCKRNSLRFSGNVAHTKNLNHGSSLSVFFLPSLHSDAVTKHYLMSHRAEILDNLVLTLKDQNINHATLSYRDLADKFFAALENNSIKYPNMRLDLLSYIPDDYTKYVKDGYVQSIESIFGCNETAGPLLLSRLDAENADTFDNTVFFKPDDFYGISFDDNGGILVDMPIYNKTVATNDKFEQLPDSYKHVGRTDVIRINDIIVDLQFLENISTKYDSNISVVIDTVENQIYLGINSIYDGNIENLIREVDGVIQAHHATNLVRVDKFAILDFKDYYFGIKIDKELMREYFRQHV
jgi:hypothetical protein